jgi:hypothetical protein
VLAMADFDARYGDYDDALRWLDLYAARQPLPREYERKRRDLLRHARRHHATLGTPND